MIHRLRLLSLAACLSFGTLTAQEEDRSISRLGNSIAAIAEGQIITLEQLRTELEPILPRLRLESKTTEEFNKRLNEMSQQILQNRIDRIIIVKAARDKGLIIPQSYIDSEYDDVIASDFDGDRGKFIRYLKQRGETPRDYRKQIYERVAVSVMRQQNRKSETEVSPERIQEFYLSNKFRFYQEEAMRLRQIILTPALGQVPADLEATTTRIMQALEDGRNFGDLAREYSTDNRSRTGGDWGWIKKADIRQELSTAAFALQPGEYSQPVTLGETTFILYCEEKREESIQPVSEVRSIIENILSGEIARENQERWLQELREKAYIKYFI
ncbi:MAG: peptidylprolyl isomerase [Verrucomicrobia bacterium]|nr:peptidylprolyl isomerase [Verrucomicrobiota bacterium]